MVRKADRGIGRGARIPRPPAPFPDPRHSPTWRVCMTTLAAPWRNDASSRRPSSSGALPPDTLDVLRQQATTRTVARNEVLFRQDDGASELFGIVTGRVAILTRSPDGRESLVAVLDEGSLFGELGLFDDGPRSADARHSKRRNSSCSATRPSAPRSTRTRPCSG